MTLGFVLIGAMPPMKAALLAISQIIGGIAASGVVSAILPGDLLLDTTLGGGTSVAQGFFIEMFLTIELILTIYLVRTYIPFARMLTKEIRLRLKNIEPHI